MAITVTWNGTPACILFLPTQQVRSMIVNGASALAQLASDDLGSGRQVTGRLTSIPIAGCVIDRAVSSKKP